MKRLLQNMKQFRKIQQFIPLYILLLSKGVTILVYNLCEIRLFGVHGSVSILVNVYLLNLVK